MEILRNKSLKFKGSYCFDKERLFICCGGKNNDNNQVISAIVISNGGIENIIQVSNNCYPCNIDEISAFKSKLIMVSKKDPLSWIDFENATSMPREIKKTFQGPIGTFFISYDGILFFSAPTVANLFATLADNCTITFPLRLDSKVSEKLKVIKYLCGHPLKPYIFIVNSIGSIQIWTYNGLRNKLFKLSGNENDINNQVEPSDKIDTEDFGESQNNSSSNAKGQAGQSLSLAALLRQPNETLLSKSESASVTSICINNNGNLAGALWNEKILCLYDIGVSKFLPSTASSDNNGINPICEIQPLCTYVFPNNYVLGSVSFHANLPVIFILTRIKNVSVCKLVMLSLLDSQLTMIKECNLDNAYDCPEALYISPTSTTIAVVTSTSSSGTSGVKSANNKKIFDLSTYALSTSLGFLLHHPITSKLTIPSDVYTEGDQLLLSSSFTATNNSSSVPLKWPLLLNLQHKVEYSRVHTPIVVSYEIYQLHPNSSTSNNNNYLSANFISTLPTTITPTSYYFEAGSRNTGIGSDSDNLTSMQFSVDDKIPFEGSFYPVSIHGQHNHNPNPNPNSSQHKNECWDAVIKGDLLASSSTPDKKSIKYASVICLVRKERSKCSFLFGHCKDATIVPNSWLNETDNNIHPVSDDSSSSCLILALSAAGDKLMLFQFPQNNNNSTWTLPSLMSSSWPCTTDSKFRKVLVVTETTQACRSLRLILLPSQSNTNNSISSSTMPLHCEEPCPPLLLLSGEIVVDVLWQPKSSSEKCTAWMGTDVNLVAVLTSQRVLVMQTNPELVILNSSSFSGNSQLSSIVIDLATSISWLGACVLVSYRSGSIRYLLPAAYDTETQGCPTIVPESIRIIYESLSIKSSEIARGLLCTLPVHQTSNGSIQIIGCLTDRLLYACYSYSEGTPTRTLVYTRPCSPFEPLVLGLLQIPYANRRIAYMDRDSLTSYLQQTSSESRPILNQLLLNYLPPPQSQVSGTEMGAVSTTHITAKVITTLLAYNQPDLAAVVAGISPIPHTGGGVAVVDFPCCSWIPRGLKFYIATRCSLFETACMEILCSCPELLDLFLDPEQYVGTFPHPLSTVCRQITAAAKLLLNLGQLKLAMKLMEMTGKNAFIPFIIELQKTLLSNSSRNDTATIDSIKEAINIIHALLPSLKIGQNYASHITLTSMGGSGRCLPISSNTALNVKIGVLDVVPVINLTEMRELYLEQKQRSLGGGGASVGGRGGLVSSLGLGILAADSVEDWMGRLYPELMSSSGDDHNTSKLNSGRLVYDINNLGAIDGMNGALDSQIIKPIGWVDGVGEGKDWDKLVGYWRFSDILYAGDEDYQESDSTVQAIFPDLSKFSHSLEVFRKHAMEPTSTTSSVASSTGTLNDLKIVTIAIEPTTSPVDPGDDHEKVKSLNDIVFTTMDKAKYGSESSTDVPLQLGMRAIVHRGGGLDVGIQPCMNDSNRGKLTLEMYVCRDAIPNATPRTTPYVLIQRVLQVPASLPNINNSGSRALLWCLWVDVEDRLCFGIPLLPSSSSPTAATATQSPPTVVKSELGRVAPPSEYPQWSHIAVTLDSTAMDTPSQISLFVNGEKCATGNISFPVLPESDLLCTLIEIAPTLSTGWRITEVRVWSDIRSSSDIETQKDNYLPLASKRKRLQFRIKGSKRLFGPPPTCYNLYATKTIYDVTSTTTATTASVDSSIVPTTTTSGLLKLTPAAMTATGSTSGAVAQPAIRSSTTLSTSASLTAVVAAATISGSKLSVPASSGAGMSTAAARRKAAAASTGSQSIQFPKDDRIDSSKPVPANPPPVPANPPPVPANPPPVPANPPPVPANPPPVPANLPPVPANPPPVPANPPPVPANPPPVIPKTFLPTTTPITDVTWPEDWKELGGNTGSIGAIGSSQWPIAKFHSLLTGSERNNSIRHSILTSNKYCTTTNTTTSSTGSVYPVSLITILPLNENSSEVVVVSFSFLPSQPPLIQRHPVPAQTETAIIQHIRNSDSTSPPTMLLALLQSKPMKISLWSMSNSKSPLIEIPMSVPLVFWKFLDSHPSTSTTSATVQAEIILVTQSTVFLWHHETGKLRKPEKIFDRIDVQDPSSWADRRITEAIFTRAEDSIQWSYGLLCSRGIHRQEQEKPLCSLHVWQSGKNVSIGLFEADGGCLCTTTTSPADADAAASTASPGSQPCCVLYSESRESATSSSSSTFCELVIVMFLYKEIIPSTTTSGIIAHKLSTLTTESYHSSSRNSNIEVIWNRRISVPISTASLPKTTAATSTRSLFRQSVISNQLVGVTPSGQVLVLDLATGNTLITLDHVTIPEPILSYEYCHIQSVPHFENTTTTDVDIEAKKDEQVIVALGATSGKLMKLSIDTNNQNQKK